jgi:hypothetical protein
MINITAQIENELDAVARKQMPFAASMALNKTAVGARDEVKANLPTRFKLRNQWTMRGIQAKTSTKHTLLAEVNAPGYMAIQETGGDRRPSSSKMLAAPSTEAKGTSVIPRGQRPRALLASGTAFIKPMANGDAAVFKRMGGKKRNKLRLMYWLTAEQSYDERFEFEADVEKYTQANFSDNLSLALAKALSR